MNHYLSRTASLAAALVACAIGTLPAQTAPSAAQADSLRKHYTDADVAFLNGMIAHHAQAVLIAGWAPSHGANASLQAMCARIVVGQTDEIHLMQQWLRGEHLPVPDVSHAMSMRMPGMSMPMMPGMLTDAQLGQLDSARGGEFDRLFLNDMIQHHTGAVTMVDALFATPAAAQVETVFRLASDVYADQTTEIDRMQRMLAALPPHRTAQ
jgi:uncharacterized protein (DUF305 family)